MASLGSYNRVIYSGVMPGGEQWSAGFCVADISSGTSVGVTDFDDLDVIATAIANMLATSPPAIKDSLFNTGSSLNHIRVEARTSPTNLVEVASADVSPYVGSSSAAALPNQSSVVLSLETGRPGASYRGRMYWPALSLSLNSNSGRIATPSPATLVTAFKDIINNTVDNWNFLAAAYVPVVVGASKSVVTEVTAVRVGDVVDTQRRRRDKLVESYTSIAL